MAPLPPQVHAVEHSRHRKHLELLLLMCTAAQRGGRSSQCTPTSCGCGARDALQLSWCKTSRACTPTVAPGAAGAVAPGTQRSLVITQDRGREERKQGKHFASTAAAKREGVHAARAILWDSNETFPSAFFCFLSKTCLHPGVETFHRASRETRTKGPPRRILWLRRARPGGCDARGHFPSLTTEEMADAKKIAKCTKEVGCKEMSMSVGIDLCS